MSHMCDGKYLQRGGGLVQRVQKGHRVVVAPAAQYKENFHNRAFARWKTGKPPCGLGKSAPPCPLRGTSPKGKRVTGFSFAQGLPTNPVPLPPRKRWQNKAPRNNYLIIGTKQSTGCCASAQRGKGGAVRHQRWLIIGMLFISYESKEKHRAAFPPTCI